MKPEAVVEAYLTAQMKRIGGLAYKFTSPSRRSVPDRMCVLPFGLVIFVECKAAKGAVTKGQEREFERLANLSQLIFVVSSKDEVDKLIQQCLTIMARRKEFKK